MKPYRRFRVILSILSLVLCLCRPAAAQSGHAAFDYRIELQVPAAQRKLLEDNLDLYRWRHNARMDEAQLRRLVRLAPEQVRELLATAGYYSPQVQARLAKANGAWRVALSVEPGAPVRVSTFSLRIVGPFDDGSPAHRARLEKMRAQWPLRPGAVFRQADWEDAKRNALKALLLEGYPTASISSSRATVDPQRDKATLELVLASGPPFTFGPIEIRGLHRYPASIVRRLNPIVAGAPYSQAKLLELQSRLQDSPYFATAEVSVKPDARHPRAMPVTVAVTENPSRKLGLGVGMSTDKGARTQVDYTDINLFDRAWRAGGGVKVDQKSLSASAELQFPANPDHSRDSLSALVESEDIAGVVTSKRVLGAKRIFVVGKKEISQGLRYINESQGIAGAGGTRAQALSPSYTWTLRDVDNLLFPTRGYLLRLEADAGAHALLSDRNFVRGYARLVYFQPLTKQNQLILRGELGVVIAGGRDGIPSDLLFRTGGDQSVRGFAYQSLGVHKDGAVVGGRYLAVASAEYVHWLTARWGAAAFIDAGNAADNLAGLHPAYGIGVGARWKSPVGPLKLDLAHGRGTRGLRLHFSVGFNF